jgi:CheY-like chemotaxis protein
VRAVTNGLQALNALRDELFDCVLLDVLMPELDGYQVLEHISRTSCAPSVTECSKRSPAAVRRARSPGRVQLT